MSLFKRVLPFTRPGNISHKSIIHGLIISSLIMKKTTIKIEHVLLYKSFSIILFLKCLEYVLQTRKLSEYLNCHLKFKLRTKQ